MSLPHPQREPTPSPECWPSILAAWFVHMPAWRQAAICFAVAADAATAAGILGYLPGREPATPSCVIINSPNSTC